MLTRREVSRSERIGSASQKTSGTDRGQVEAIPLHAALLCRPPSDDHS